MDTSFRSRFLAPILIPLAIVVVMVGFVGSVAALLLFNTKTGSLAFAAVAASGILFTISLAAGRDRLDTRGRLVLSAAAVLPFALGLGVATGVLGDVADEDRMINVLPLITIPEDAPVIAAENSLEFCLIDESGVCIPTTRWDVVPGATTENISFVFENLEPQIPHNVVITLLDGTSDDPRPGQVIAEDGTCVPTTRWDVVPGSTDTISFLFENLEPQIPHNVVITLLEGTVDAPAPGQVLVESTLISGISREYYVAEDISWDDLPETWYFFCRVHANMNGVGTVITTEG